MKKIFYASVVLSLVFILNSVNAGTTDVWKECGTATCQVNVCTVTFDGTTYYCCAGPVWQTTPCAPVCTRNTPTVTITPSSQTGSPGQTLTYTVKFTNTDTGCASSDFTLSVNTCPTPLTCDLQPPTSFTGVPPGDTRETKIQVTSSPTAANGKYTFSVLALNRASGVSGVGSAVYEVTTTCVRVNPTVTITPSSQTGSPGQTLTYKVNVQNNDASICGTSIFDLSFGGSCPSGFICNLETISLSISPGSTGSTQSQITSPTTASSGTYTFTVIATNKNDLTKSGLASATYVIPAPGCVYSLSISPSSDTFTDTTKTWTITATDSSSSACPSSITYSISKTQTGTCSSVVVPISLTVTRGGTTTFSVSITRGKSSCTLDISLISPANTTVATGRYTVTTVGSPKVTNFEFLGDIATFTARWEAFYPVNPARPMNVKCSIWNARDNSCDPTSQDCSNVVGKTCIPHPYLHGTEKIKKGSCSVINPVYDLPSSENKIICVFYDPNNPSLSTVINHAFTPINFESRSSERITAQVGQSVELKVDINNKGLLPDSYNVALSASYPNSIDLTPDSANSDTIPSNSAGNVFFSVLPLVDQPNEIKVRVTSNTCPVCIPKEITVLLSTGLFTLPEFGIFGWLQIVAIAAVLYFLVVNRIIGKRKKK